VEKDKQKYVESFRERYPHAFEAPYEGIPKDVFGNFVWVPQADKGVALFLFADEEDRDRLAARYESKRKKKAA